MAAVSEPYVTRNVPGLRAGAGRFVVGVLGVLVARDLKVFYTHKFYTHAFFWIFFGIFGDFLEYFAQKVSSTMDSGMYFLSKAPPQIPQKNPPAASAGLKGVCLKLLCRYAYQMTAHICTLYTVYISSIHYLHHEYSTKKNSLRKFLEQIPVGDFLFKSQIDSKTYR